MVSPLGRTTHVGREGHDPCITRDALCAADGEPDPCGEGSTSTSGSSRPNRCHPPLIGEPQVHFEAEARRGGTAPGRRETVPTRLRRRCHRAFGDRPRAALRIREPARPSPKRVPSPREYEPPVGRSIVLTTWRSSSPTKSDCSAAHITPQGRRAIISSSFVGVHGGRPKRVSGPSSSARFPRVNEAEPCLCHARRQHRL